MARNLRTALGGSLLRLRGRCAPPICEPWFGHATRSCGSSKPPEESPGRTSREVDPMVMTSIQDLIQGLSYHSPAALKELFEASCQQFMKYGQSRPEDVKNFDRMEKAFMQKASDIIRKHTEEGSFQERLLQDLDGCYQSFEILQGRLDDTVNARFRIDDQELEGDEHEPVLMKNAKDWHGTEAHPCHQRWVMDAQVDYQDGDQTSPRLEAEEKRILLSNLPDACEEETVRANLAGCGEIADVEICREWKEMVEATREGPETTIVQDGKVLGKAPPSYTLSYALIEFKEAAARQRATRQLCRLHGILFKEVRLVKLSRKYSLQAVARPCFPQDLRFKKSLLLRGVPIHMDPSEVLQAVLSKLREVNVTVRGVLLNCRAFRVRGGGPLEQLEVQVGPDGCDVYQEPPDVRETLDDDTLHCCPAGNGGELVLRFKTFQEAYISRSRLKALELGGRRVYAGFPPWRPQAVWTDSRGYDLAEVRLLDLAVPRASALYRRELDPVHAAPSHEEVEAMAKS